MTLANTWWILDAIRHPFSIDVAGELGHPADISRLTESAELCFQPRSQLQQLLMSTMGLAKVEPRDQHQAASEASSRPGAILQRRVGDCHPNRSKGEHGGAPQGQST